jgi:hypothetical protein
MKLSQIRNWLGIYFLLITGILGGYILLFKETTMLPISHSDGLSAFQIIIPVLVGQLTLIFKWYGAERAENDEIVNIPVWVIKVPPLMVSVLLILSISILVFGNLGDGKSWAISPDSFKTIVTFCVTILNATSVFIVLRFFKVN